MSKRTEAIKKAVFYAQQKPELLADFLEKYFVSNFELGVSLAPAPTEEQGVANNSKVVSVVLDEDDVATITVNVDDLEAFPSSNPSQGTHKWIALEIATGVEPVTDVRYNGAHLEEQDVADAKVTGCKDGSFVLYIKADEVAITPKEFTIKAQGYATRNVTVKVAESTA